MAEKKKAKVPAPKPAVKKKKTAKPAEEGAVLEAEAPVGAVEEAVPVVHEPVPAPVHEKPVHHVHRPKKEKQPRPAKYYGTGRRKEAVAKVWLKAGSGEFSVNGKTLGQYFCGRKTLEHQILKPFAVTNTAGKYDVVVDASGGGVPAQAGAVTLGIARALLELSPDFRVKLKREGLLSRDPRMKERKKYGLKRARRAFQYSKR